MELSKDAKATIQKVKGITSNVKKVISTAKLIDCTPQENESSIARIIRLNKDVKRQEAGIKSALYRAGSQLTEFRSRWARTYLSEGQTLTRNNVVKNALSEVKETLVGTVRFGEATSDAPTTSNARSVRFRPSKFELKQAIQF